MKRKERKQLAEKIAKVQLKYDATSDQSEKQKLEVEMMDLCSKVDDMEDMIVIDEMVANLLLEKSKKF